MLASIIIATRNRSAALRETLRALAELGHQPGLQTEVIVVDNGSSDDTRACVAAAALPSRVKYLHQSIPGKSRALNTALRAAHGDILAFLDDDVRPDRDWLAQITAPIVDERFDAVGGAVRIAPHLMRPWMKPAHLAWLASTHDVDPIQPKSAVGANVAIGRHVLERVPEFDTELGPGRLGLWEDTLFTLQLRDAGYRLGFNPAAKVEHHFDPARLSRLSFLAHARHQGRSAAYVAWHWDHERRGPTSRFAFYYRARLLARRFLRVGARLPTEGIATWEMDLTCGIAFARQFHLERRRPQRYPRRGKGGLEFTPALYA